ncbi:hypothetical protein HPB47_000250 [Ixodes persulcatus]|uniref:Uncharacterized protein n=1 Tax=Ixodes persulcatus TaxID=34615 RepID=A0AC60PS96_IXOPE|nr:hypothetical protein HPB47_000250 [Ixodes persulcatus]
MFDILNKHYSPEFSEVDHFGYANNDTFQMRYLVADQYWDHDGGPIFFYTGGEGNIEAFANKSYSGPSRHGYLTVEQALADYAYLLTHFKAHVPGAGDSKVVSFGGSYGGMLAAWFRFRYPHVTMALQFFLKTDLRNHFPQVVTKAFAKESNQCTNAIRTSFELMRKQAATEEGAKALKEQFRLCKPLAPRNYTVLRDWIRNAYSYLAMVNYPYASKLILPAPGHPVKEACKFLEKNFTDVQSLLDGVYRAISLLRNYTGKIHCNDLPDSAGKPEVRGWHIQSCNEMVMPICSNGKTDMFFDRPWIIENVTANCEKKFGLTPDVHKAALIFGGKNISAASNIIFSNGDLDPWSAGGVLTNLSDSLIALYITEAAHHLDLRSSNPADPESVVAARKVEKIYIKKWLREAQASA